MSYSYGYNLTAIVGKCYESNSKKNKNDETVNHSGSEYKFSELEKELIDKIWHSILISNFADFFEYVQLFRLDRYYQDLDDICLASLIPYYQLKQFYFSIINLKEYNSLPYFKEWCEKYIFCILNKKSS